MENTGKKCRWAVKALLALVWLVVAGVVCYAALIGLEIGRASCRERV